MSKKAVELSMPEIMGAQVQDVMPFLAWLGILTAKVRHYTGFSGEFIVDCRDGEFFIMAFDETPMTKRARLEKDESEKIRKLCELSRWARGEETKNR
jgi:hypothetical protein